MDRLTRIKELLTKKQEIDAEIKALKETVRAESASLRAPRKARKLGDPQPPPLPAKADGKTEQAKK